MATSFSLLSGVNVMNGMTASSTLLNNLVDLATFSSSTDSILISFDVNGNPADMPFQYPQTGFNFNNTGSSYHTTSLGMTIADNSASTQMVIGQASAFGLQIGWNYNATSANASGYIQTVNGATPLNIIASGTTVTGGLTYDRARAVVTAIASSSTYTLDFTAQVDVQTVTLSSGITFSAQNWVSGASKTLQVINGSSATASLGFSSAWVFVGNSKPTSIQASKQMIFSVISWGNSDALVTATFVAQQ